MDLPTFVIQTFTLTADIIVLLFFAYYFIQVHHKEKELNEKHKKIDADYHRVVDDALTKERKIVDDATREANQIITEAQHVSTTSKDTINHALQKMVVDIQMEAVATSRDFMSSYQASLKELSIQSLNDFQNTTKDLENDLQKQVEDFKQAAKGMEDDLRKQIQQFNETLLPNLQKELDAYKETRMEQTEQTITRVVQKVSQEVLNKAISVDDHEKLIIDSLDRAKRQGIFD